MSFGKIYNLLYGKMYLHIASSVLVVDGSVYSEREGHLGMGVIVSYFS